MRRHHYNFVFFVEHEDREFEINRRLAENLQCLGYSVAILSLAFQSHLIPRLGADVIILPFVKDVKSPPLVCFSDAQLQSSKIVSLNWEQYLSAANARFKSPSDSFVRNAVFHISMHDAFSEYLKENGVAETNIHRTGDFLLELMLEKLARPESESVIHNVLPDWSGSPIWFLPMNYGWAFLSDRVLKNKIKMGYDEDIAYAYRDYSIRCFRSFIWFVNHLSEVYLKDVIVIRPHPSVSVESYEYGFAKYGFQVPSNVIITKKGTVVEWIHAATVVGSSWSTSVLHAHRLGKKTFLFTPFQRPNWLHVSWNDSITDVRVIEDLKKVRYPGDRVAIGGDVCGKVSVWLQAVRSLEVADISLPERRGIKRSYHLWKGLGLSLSMKFFKGWGVPAGLRRDYFKPIMNGSVGPKDLTNSRS